MRPRTGGATQYTSDSNKPSLCVMSRDVGDYSRMKSEFRDSSIVTSAKEMVDAGVITVVAPGNSNPKTNTLGSSQIMTTTGILVVQDILEIVLNQQFGYNVMPKRPTDRVSSTCWSRLGDPRHITLQ